jgi:hypothetical protein
MDYDGRSQTRTCSLPEAMGCFADTEAKKFPGSRKTSNHGDPNSIANSEKAASLRPLNQLTGEAENVRRQK